MRNNNEINALLRLIDDPDEEVYQSITQEILSLDKSIIPQLESIWEQTVSTEVQERIESLIHRLHFRDLTADFLEWKENDQSLLSGALLVSKYHFPDLDEKLERANIEKMRRNIWLETNSYLTPLEQVNVMNSILFNYYKQTTVETDYNQPENFLLSQAISNKKGNAISNGILYLLLSQMQDFPIKAIRIPKQFILGYFDHNADIAQVNSDASKQIKFFIDGLNGQVYSLSDIENYMNKINVPMANHHFKPMNNFQVIDHLLQQFAKCFDNYDNEYKKDELLQLAELLKL